MRSEQGTHEMHTDRVNGSLLKKFTTEDKRCFLFISVHMPDKIFVCLN